MTAEPADTPDIVERLNATIPGWPSVAATLTEAVDTILALRAAQSPQARDEGGAVEAWVMVPRVPTDEMIEAYCLTQQHFGFHGWANASAIWPKMLAAAPSPPTDAINTAEGEAHPPKVWRCFQCDEVFTDEACAREHFGEYQDCDPICKVGAERYRDLETQLAAFRSESDETSKAFYSQGADHARALMRAEEAGYAKGLRDAVASPPQAPQDVAGLLAEVLRRVPSTWKAEPTNPKDLTDLGLAHRLAAALTPPTDAINTAEGEAWLAQRGETATGLMRREPPHNPMPMPKYEFQTPDTSGGSTLASPPQAPQDVAGLVAEAERWAEHPTLGALPRRLIKRLAAALTPRELTDEEAERGARAFVLAWYPNLGREIFANQSFPERDRCLTAARAAYRAITEEPAR